MPHVTRDQKLVLERIQQIKQYKSFPAEEDQYYEEHGESEEYEEVYTEDDENVLDRFA